MCDESLSTSSEALLSRISKLEEMLLSGRFNAPAESDVPTEAPTSVQAPEPRTIHAQQPQTKPEVKTQAPAPKAKDVDTEGKRVLRPLRAWPEVVERVTRQSGMAASFLKTAACYTEGESRVIIRFDNDFALMMIDRGDAKDILRGALSVCLQREVKERDLVCEVKPKESEANALDEIIEELEQDF
jgi:hypothetical protein